MMEDTAISIPEDPFPDVDKCRIWIGNMDTRVTEFTMMKIVQRYGELKKFDFLYNKAGIDIGKPRGYCFVSYHSRESADKARRSLNGRIALTKKLIVRWAHQEKPKDDIPFKRVFVEEVTASVDVKIHAIESKLKEMADTQKDFATSTQVAAPPGSSKLSIANPENYRNQVKSKPYYKKPTYQYKKHRR